MISSFINVWRTPHSFPSGEELIASAARSVNINSADRPGLDAGEYVASIVADAVLRVFSGDFSGESSPAVHPPLRKRLELQNDQPKAAPAAGASVVFVAQTTCGGLCAPVVSRSTRRTLRHKTAKIAPAPESTQTVSVSRTTTPLRLSLLSAPAHVDVPFVSATLEVFFCSVVAALGGFVSRGSAVCSAALIESTALALDALRTVGGAVSVPRGNDSINDALADAAALSDDNTVVALRRGTPAVTDAALSPKASLCAIGHILRHAAALAATPVLAFSPALALRAAAASSLARDAPPMIARAARVPALVAAANTFLCRPSVRGGDVASSPLSAGFSIAVLAALVGAWPLSSPLPVAVDGDLRMADLLRVFGGEVKVVVIRGLSAPLPRCRTNVHRQSVLDDAADALARPGLIFPRFFRDASTEEEDNFVPSISRLPSNRSSRSSSNAPPPLHSATPTKITFSVATDCATAVEDGEGHGPRKEFFYCVGVAATDSFGPAEPLPDTTLVSVEGADEGAPVFRVKSALRGTLPAVTAWFHARLEISSSALHTHRVLQVLSAEEIGPDAPLEYLLRVDAQDVAIARAAVSTPHTLVLRRARAPLFSWSPSLGGHVPSSKSLTAALNGGAEQILALRATGAALAAALFNAAHVTPLVPALSVLAQVLPRPAVHDKETRGIQSRFGSALSLSLDRFGSNSSIPSTPLPGLAVSAAASSTDATGTRPKKSTPRETSAANASTSTCLLWTWGGDAEWEIAQCVLRARGDALDALSADGSAGGEGGGFDSRDFGVGGLSGGGSIGSWAGSETCSTGSEADRAARLAASALDASLFLDAESAPAIAALRGGAAAALSETAAKALHALDFSPLDWRESIVSRALGDTVLPCLSQTFRVVHDRTTPRELVDALLAVFRFWATSAPEIARKFLTFATGTPHLPSPYSEILRVEAVGFPPQSLAAAKGVLCTLPTSHACTNTIELPHYASAIKLGARGTSDVNQRLREWAAQDDVAQRDDMLALVVVIEGQLRAAVEDGMAGGYTLDEL